MHASRSSRVPIRYLVTWDGFAKPPGRQDAAPSAASPGDADPLAHRHHGSKFRYMTEPALRAFLLERIREGYRFPLNPKWVLADRGWVFAQGLEPWCVSRARSETSI